MSLRINLFGGSGVGKSRNAAWLYTELKTRNCSVEISREWVKKWAYEKHTIGPFDQLEITAQQFREETDWLNAGVKNVICECPLLLGPIYAEIYNSPIANALYDIVSKYEKRTHPAINIILKRGDKPYIQEGRYQTLEEARIVDMVIEKRVYGEYSHDVKEVDWNDQQSLFDVVWKSMVEYGTNK